ncbi:hypothetical protein G6L37_02975 [Agrobacterium rubi]|nr:hypothetical protein [Agrobacterium rubi]NTF24341.1 hypothetical protein [Agrobacterium rubi]
MATRITELADTRYSTIKQWFGSVVDHIGGEGWHADDDPFDIINIRTGERVFTDEEARIVTNAMRKIRPAADGWVDPDQLYTFAGDGVPRVEKDYPGFTLDVSLLAGRLGNVTIPGRALPNLLVEEYGQYALLEFPDSEVPVSQQELFILKAVKKSSVSDHPIDPRKLVVLEDQTLEFHAIGDLEEKLVEMAKGGRTIRP